MTNIVKNKYLDVLQIFRGVAALMVVIHHATGSLKHYHNINNAVLNFVGAIGKYGVDFFFLISGFIISYAAYYKYNEPNAFANYIKNRIIRIYVPYLPIGIFMFLLYSFFPGFSNGNRDLSVLTSFTLIPYGSPALSVAWTLSFEICFYIMFSITFFSKKAWHYFLLLWFGFIIVFNYGKYFNFQLPRNVFTNLLCSSYNIEFMLGYILSGLIINNKVINLKIAFPLLFIFAFAFGISLYFHYSLFDFSVNLLFSIFSFLIIYISISHFNVSISKKMFMMLIGNSTYSIYLVHNPLQMIIIRFFPKITSALSIALALGIVLIMSCVVGYTYYYIFEKRGINFIKQKLIS